MPFLLVFAAILLNTGPALATCRGLNEGLSASITRVLDAQTLRLHDGSELRLAGVLVPRADDAGAGAGRWPADVAARAEVEALVLGKSVSVAFGSERRDRYGRHLAHVFIGDADERRWLQGHLLAQGLARVVTRAGDQACEAEMLVLERGARDARLAIWKEAAYQVRQSHDVDALSALMGTFQLVEGTVTDSRRIGAGLRLDFAEKGRFGFTVLAPRSKGGQGREALKGRSVRVRGWLEERSGRPTLDLAVIGTLEVLNAPDSGPESGPESGQETGREPR